MLIDVRERNTVMLQNPIGGFLPAEVYAGEHYHANALKFNLGRSAFIFIVLQRNYRKVYLPYYLCDCMANTLKKYQISVEYYRIDENLRPVLPPITALDTAILIVNYFGILTEEDIAKFKATYHHIIVDNTQAFYARACRGTDTVYTSRKWFGVADGAYLYTDMESKDYEQLPLDYSARRMYHLYAKLEKPDENYYPIYSEIENLFDRSGILRMSKTTENMLKSIDYQRCANIRRSNYQFLKEQLDAYNQLKINIHSVPFMYALYSEKAAEIRNNLKVYGCFLPLLWPNVLQLNPNCFEHKAAQNILLLPCDQRYTHETMREMSDLIKKML